MQWFIRVSIDVCSLQHVWVGVCAEILFHSWWPHSHFRPEWPPKTRMNRESRQWKELYPKKVSSGPFLRQQMFHVWQTFEFTSIMDANRARCARDLVVWLVCCAECSELSVFDTHFRCRIKFCSLSNIGTVSTSFTENNNQKGECCKLRFPDWHVHPCNQYPSCFCVNSLTKVLKNRREIGHHLGCLSERKPCVSVLY